MLRSTTIVTAMAKATAVSKAFMLSFTENAPASLPIPAPVDPGTGYNRYL